MTIGIIITVLIAVAVLAFAVVNLFIGWKRNWVQSLLRLLATGIAAVAAWPLTELIVGKASGALYALALRVMSSPTAYVDKLGEWLDKLPDAALINSLSEGLLNLLGSLAEGFEGFAQSIVDFLTAVPVGADGVLALLSMIVSPILFLLLFVVLRALLALILLILGSSVPALKKTTLRGVSLPVGALNGVLMVMVLLIPLCGFLTTGSHLIRSATEAHLLDFIDLRTIPVVQDLLSDEVDSKEAALLDVADDLENNPAVWAIHNSIGRPVYDSLTTVTLDVTHTHGETVEMNLERELGYLVKTVGHVIEVKDVFTKDTFTEEDKEVLYAMADSFFESEWIKMFATDAIAEFATCWKENRPCLGISRPTLDANLNPTLNCILDTLSHEEGDDLEEDIHTVLDVTGDLLVADLLSDMGDYENMVRKLGESGLLTKMLAKLDANPRLHPLAAEIKSLSIRLVTSMLGVDKINSGEYDEHLDSMASTLTDVLEMPKEERDQLVIDGVKDALSDQDFDLPEDVILEVSDKMMEDLGEDGVITGDELKQYMMDHADEAFDLGVENLPEDLPESLPEGWEDQIPQ